MSDSVEVHPSGRAGIKRLVRGNGFVGSLAKGADGQWKVYGEDRRLVTEETFPDTLKARDAFARLEGGPRLPERLPESVKMEAAGFPGAKRLMRDGQVVAMLLQLTSGRWLITDTNEQKLTKVTFATPAKARDGFLELELAASKVA